jgi:hypothetical protein
MERLKSKGMAVDLQVMDNEASADFKANINNKWKATFQLVPPDMHCCNKAEGMI